MQLNQAGTQSSSWCRSWHRLTFPSTILLKYKIVQCCLEVYMTAKVSIAMVGLGSMARVHLKEILKHTKTTTVAVVCEPSQEAYQEFQEI